MTAAKLAERMWEITKDQLWCEFQLRWEERKKKAESEFHQRMKQLEIEAISKLEIILEKGLQ